MLYAYCMAVKADNPSWARVVGIATEPPKYNVGKNVSEDLLLVEPEVWTPEMQAETDRLRAALKIMQKETLQFGRFKAREYPNIRNVTRAERRREAKKRRKEAKRARRRDSKE